MTMRASDLGLPTKYVLKGLLGEGSFASVYRAYDSETEQVVALKVLSSFAAALGPVRSRLRREARAYAEIRHPNVLRLLEAQCASEPVFLVLEYVQGFTLDEFMANKKPSLAQAIDIFRQLALGAGALHAKALVHRDIKPKNVLVQPDKGRALLADLNLVFSQDYTPLTETGTVLGTPLYFAPEFGLGAEPSPQSDVFSLGLVTIEMLTGKPAMSLDEVTKFLAGGSFPALPKASSLPVDLSPELGKILLRCLSMDPSERFADGGVLAEALQRGLDDISDISFENTLSEVASYSNESMESDEPSARAARVWPAFFSFLICVVLLSIGLRVALGPKNKQLSVNELRIVLLRPGATANTEAFSELTSLMDGEGAGHSRQSALLLLARSAVQSSLPERAAYWYESLLKESTEGNREHFKEFVQWNLRSSRFDKVLQLVRKFRQEKRITHAILLAETICAAHIAPHLTKGGNKPLANTSQHQSLITLLDELLTTGSTVKPIGGLTEMYVELLCCPGVANSKSKLIELAKRLESSPAFDWRAARALGSALAFVFDADADVMKMSQDLIEAAKRLARSPVVRMRLEAFSAFLLSRKSYFSKKRVSGTKAREKIALLRQRADEFGKEEQNFLRVMQAFINCHSNHEKGNLKATILKCEDSLKGLEVDKLSPETSRWYYLAKAELAVDKGKTSEAAELYKQAFLLSQLHQRPFVRTRIVVSSLLPLLGHEGGY